MNRKIIMTLLIVVFLSSCSTVKVEKESYWANCNFNRVTQRTETFTTAINGQSPEVIYSMLSENYQSMIDSDEFVRRYNDDLTYPYISPLYCYIQGIQLHYDIKGVVTCSVASRLIGDSFVFNTIYENGDYYFEAFLDIIDNSYRNKFANKVVKWI